MGVGLRRRTADSQIAEIVGGAVADISPQDAAHRRVHRDRRVRLADRRDRRGRSGRYLPARRRAPPRPPGPSSSTRASHGSKFPTPPEPVGENSTVDNSFIQSQQAGISWVQVSNSAGAGRRKLNRGQQLYTISASGHLTSSPVTARTRTAATMFPPRGASDPRYPVAGAQLARNCPNPNCGNHVSATRSIRSQVSRSGGPARQPGPPGPWPS